jgi:hypothetical protein
MAALKLYALATVRTQRWLTRDVEVIGDEVVRTNEPDDAADAVDVRVPLELPREQRA